VGIAEQIRDKQKRLMEIEAEAITIRRELLEAKQQLLGTVEGARFDPSPIRQGKQPSGNSTEWATSVLKVAGRPMHVNEIIAAIERDFHVTVRYATLVGNIARLVKKSRVFERTGPNVFGLVEWRAEEAAEALFGRPEDNGHDGERGRI
jgi:hypothetical protein